LKSRKIFKVEDKEYVVVLRTYELRFEILDALANVVVVSGKAKALHQLKIRAKRALANLGVAFEFENREKYEFGDGV
jgi:hypothetical protein